MSGASTSVLRLPLGIAALNLGLYVLCLAAMGFSEDGLRLLLRLTGILAFMLFMMLTNLPRLGGLVSEPVAKFCTDHRSQLSHGFALTLLIHLAAIWLLLSGILDYEFMSLALLAGFLPGLLGPFGLIPPLLVILYIFAMTLLPRQSCFQGLSAEVRSGFFTFGCIQIYAGFAYAFYVSLDRDFVTAATGMGFLLISFGHWLWGRYAK